MMASSVIHVVTLTAKDGSVAEVRSDSDKLIKLICDAFVAAGAKHNPKLQTYDLGFYGPDAEQ